MSFWQSPSMPSASVAQESSPIDEPVVAATHEETANGIGRQFLESLICLAIAVLTFRCFALEGYIISTGSMAPNLLGYHKRIECPDCGNRFPFGVAFDREVTTSPLVRCPNCMQPSIDVSEVPRNDGDQLLVFKQAFEFRDPKRWEIVVFLNPANPLQAYVKRVVGLPGESIQVRDGDVFINGKLERKSLEKQRTLRIPVFDQSLVAKSDDWLPRWVPDAGWGQTEQSFIRSTATDEEGFAWVQYRNWPRRVADPIAGVPRSLAPHPISDCYGYNRIFGMDEDYPVRDLTITAKIEVPDHGQFAAVLETGHRLAVCVLDRQMLQARLYVVRDESQFDAIAAGQITPLAKCGLTESALSPGVELEFSNFDQTLNVALDRHAILKHELEVEPASATPSGRTVAPRTMAKTIQPPEEIEDVDGGFSVPPTGTTARAEISIAGYSTKAPEAPTVDEINSTSAALSADSLPQTSNRSPIRFGATSGAFRVRELKIYRDIHYLSEAGQHACNEPWQLGDDEFFFLGDNSPVSLDSRGWKHPAVPRHLLVGRPLCVHLPSRPAQFRFGSSSTLLRLPDFESMRWIR